MSFSDKLTLDESNLKILHENRKEQPLGGFRLFKHTLMKNFWQSVKINWLSLVFVAPVIVWVFFWRMAILELNATLPYSSNIGIGYPFIPNVDAVSLSARFSLGLNRALLMIPMIGLACVGLAGAFNVMKYIVWGMDVKIIKTFFKGIKNSFLPFIWMGVILSLCFFMLVMFWYGFGVYDFSLGGRIVLIILGSIISLFALMMSVFVFTQASMFSLPILDILKNALRLALKFVIQSIFIAVIGVSAIFLIFIPATGGGIFGTILTAIGFIFFFMFAFSWLASAYTIYSHFIFDAMYDSQKKGEDKRGGDSYDNGHTHVPQQANPQKKKQKQVYINPKKGKKN